MSQSYQRHGVPSHPIHHPGNHPPGHSPKHPIHHPPPRYIELLDALKHEVDGLHEEATFSKHHRKDLDAKLSAQVSEMQQCKQAIYDLERLHSQIKKQYEDEIMRLRSELESRGIPVPIPTEIRPQYRKLSIAPDTAPPPNLGSGNRSSMGSFGNLMQAGHHPFDKNDSNHPQKRLKGPDGVIQPPPSLGNIPRHRDSIPNLKAGQPPPSLIKRGPEDHRMPPDYRQHYPGQPLHQQSLHHPPRPITPPTQKPPVPQIAPQEDLQLVVHPKLRQANINVEQVHCFEHSSVVCCVKFSPDGKYLATGCNHYAQIFEIASGRKLLALVDESITAKQEDLYIRSVCFSPDGVYLATGAEDKVIRVWDIVRGKVKNKLFGHEQDIYSLDWTRDGKFIVSGSGDRTVKVWDAETGQLVRTMTNDSDELVDQQSGKDSGVTSVAVRPTDGRCVGSLDEVIRVWDIRTGHLLSRFQGHEKSVYSVSFSPDGNSIVSGSLDQTLRIWDIDVQTNQVLANSPGTSKPPVVNITKSRQVYQGHQDYVLTVGYPGSISSLGRVDSIGRPIQDPAFDIDWVVSGGKDRHVLFWDASTTEPNQQPLMSMSGHKNSVISIAMGPVGGLFATGSGDQKARIWRISRKVVDQGGYNRRKSLAESPSINPPSQLVQPLRGSALSLPVMKPVGSPSPLSQGNVSNDGGEYEESMDTN